MVVPPQAGEELLTTLQDNDVEISAAQSGQSFASEVLIYLIVFGLPIVVFVWLFRRLSKGATSQLQGVLGAGQSRAKVFDEERPSTTFADVAGYDGAKAEIAEVVDFLKHPDRYTRVGATAPRGVLMVGPPGTGKTLLARAVAGEAGVPFFSVTGSSFVEMFVGVGAARVRDLFAEARKRAPGIIFIDEIDAIGQRRAGSGACVSNDEREQTLNQLLAEMDGFDPTTGIVVLAATNRPEVLDPALLRPGRFDRQVTIPLPNVSERAAILAVHCRGKQLASRRGPEHDRPRHARLLRRRPGQPGQRGRHLRGADRPRRDHRRGLRRGQGPDLLGRREGSNVLLPEEKHAVAVHESGHALVAALSEHADPVAKVTILPAGPGARRHRAAPAGRAAPVRRGLPARLARRPPRRPGRRAGRARPGLDRRGQRPGRGDRPGRQDGPGVRPVAELGPVGYPEGGSVFLGGGGPGMSSRPYAEATQAAIDGEVARLLREAEERAVDLLGAPRRARRAGRPAA